MPAAVLARRIEGFVSSVSGPRRLSSAGGPETSLATDFVAEWRDGVVGSVGRVSIALVMVSPMVDGLRRKLMIGLRCKEVKRP